MKNLQFLSFVAIAAFVFLVGCDSKPAGTTTGVGGSSNSGEHVHDDGTVHQGHDVEGHTHGKGPHGGVVADWGGGKFHVELTVDHDKQQATVFILGGDEKTATPIDAEEVTLTIKDPTLTVALKPSPQESDSDGKASRFVGTHENLGIAKEYEGSLSAAVSGTPYSGNFKEVAHEH